jgi:hypothetical protein
LKVNDPVVPVNVYVICPSHFFDVSIYVLVRQPEQSETIISESLVVLTPESVIEVHDTVRTKSAPPAPDETIKA